MRLFWAVCLAFSIKAAEAFPPWSWEEVDQTYPLTRVESGDISPYFFERWDEIFPTHSEEWGVRYDDPGDRDIFGMIVPRKENVPYYFDNQVELVRFRGCEFWPNQIVGRDFHKERRATYGPQWTVSGWEGVLVCFPDLWFTSPATNYGLPTEPSVGLGLSVRWQPKKR